MLKKVIQGQGRSRERLGEHWRKGKEKFQGCRTRDGYPVGVAKIPGRGNGQPLPASLSSRFGDR